MGRQHTTHCVTLLCEKLCVAHDLLVIGPIRSDEVGLPVDRPHVPAKEKARQQHCRLADSHRHPELSSERRVLLMLFVVLPLRNDVAVFVLTLALVGDPEFSVPMFFCPGRSEDLLHEQKVRGRGPSNKDQPAVLVVQMYRCRRPRE